MVGAKETEPVRESEVQQLGTSRPPLGVDDLPEPEEVFKVSRLGPWQVIQFVIGPSLIALVASAGGGHQVRPADAAIFLLVAVLPSAAFEDVAVDRSAAGPRSSRTERDVVRPVREGVANKDMARSSCLTTPEVPCGPAVRLADRGIHALGDPDALRKWRTVSAATGTPGWQDAREQVVPFDTLSARACDIHAGVPRAFDDHHEGLRQLGCARVCALERRSGIIPGVQHQNRRGRAPVPGAGVAVGVVALPEGARDRAEDGDSAEIRL